MSKTRDDALYALEELLQFVYDALDHYLKASTEFGTIGDARFLADGTLTWLEKEGSEIIESLRHKILAADEATQADMLISLKATIRSGEAAISRDMTNEEYRNMLWFWADEVLLSMEKAWQLLPEEAVQ